MISGWGWRNDCEVPGHFLLLDANPKFNKCGCGSDSGSPRLFRFVFMNRSLGISTSSSSNGWTTLLVSCDGMGVSRGRGISILYAYMNAFISEQSMCWVSDHPTSPLKWILQRYRYRVLTQMTPPQFLRNNAFIYPWHDLHRRARPRAISAGPTRVHWTEFAGIDTIYPNVLAFLESGQVWGIRIRI